MDPCFFPSTSLSHAFTGHRRTAGKGVPEGKRLLLGQIHFKVNDYRRVRAHRKGKGYRMVKQHSMADGYPRPIVTLEQEVTQGKGFHTIKKQTATAGQETAAG